MRQERVRQGTPWRPAAASAATLVHRPFDALGRLVRSARAATPAPPVPPATPADPSADFLHAVADVTPLDARVRQRVAERPPATPARPATDPDAEALAALCDLVAGTAPFDVTDSDEYIEGAMVGIDPRLVRRLRGGEFAYQAHLDLHGLTAEEARSEVDRFLSRAYAESKRCVLIIHGRGKNSKDQVPVLKNRLTAWLARGQAARRILAFTSARACDGGAGALYVLLRRQRSVRRPIRVTEGAKW